MDEAVRQPAGDAGFLAGGGEMGALLRAHDWEASPLGAPQGWPQPLKTLAGLMLAANQPMFVAWGRGRTLLYNDAYAEILASKHPAALGRDFLEVWHEIRADLLPIVEQAYAGRPVHMDDIALTMERRGYPEETHFAFSYTPVRDEAGAVAGFLCPCVEITEQVLAERRRAFRLAFEERLRDLADPDAIMAEAVAFLGRRMGFDRVGYSEIVGGRVVRARGSFAASGMAPLNEDFPIESFGEAMVARQRQGVTEVNGDVLAGPERADEVWAAIGTRSFVSVPLVREERLVASLYVNNRAPRRWSPDEVALIEEVAARTWDAVERARAETALRELNETLEARVAERTAERDRTWRLSQDLLVVVKPDGTLAAVNEAWTAALGWEERELVGRTFMELAHPDDVEPAFKVFTATFETPLTEPYEFRLRHTSGEHRWIAWTAAFEDGRVFANGRDVTAERARAAELALAQEQLRQSQKMEAVGQLTGGLAHDFNNLLAGLSGSLEMMEARIAQGRVAEVERYLAAAQGAARRAAALTHRLLAFSRRQTLEPKPTDVNRLVADMEELIRRTVGPAVRVEAVAAAGLWPTLVDPHQLENALLNLCLNARDAMPGGGHDHRRDRQPPARRARGARARPRARPIRVALRVRHRHGHDARGGEARVRSVLHHQAPRRGDRARAQHDLRLRAPERGPGAHPLRAGAGHHRVPLPAAPPRAGGGRWAGAGAGGRAARCGHGQDGAGDRGRGAGAHGGRGSAGGDGPRRHRGGRRARGAGGAALGGARGPADHRRGPAGRHERPAGGRGGPRAAPRAPRAVRHRLRRERGPEPRPPRPRHGHRHQALRPGPPDQPHPRDDRVPVTGASLGVRRSSCVVRDVAATSAPGPSRTLESRFRAVLSANPASRRLGGRGDRRTGTRTGKRRRWRGSVRP